MKKIIILGSLFILLQILLHIFLPNRLMKMECRDYQTDALTFENIYEYVELTVTTEATTTGMVCSFELIPLYEAAKFNVIKMKKSLGTTHL